MSTGRAAAPLIRPREARAEFGERYLVIVAGGAKLVQVERTEAIHQLARSQHAARPAFDQRDPSALLRGSAPDLPGFLARENEVDPRRFRNKRILPLL